MVGWPLLAVGWLCTIIACDGWFNDVWFIELIGRSAVAGATCWSDGWLGAKPALKIYYKGC